MDETTIRTFLESAQDWVCDDYFLDVRFMAEVEDGKAWIWYASVYLNPLPATQDINFQIGGRNFIVGQTQSVNKKEFLIDFLRKATNGILSVSGKDFVLPVTQM